MSRIVLTWTLTGPSTGLSSVPRRLMSPERNTRPFARTMYEYGLGDFIQPAGCSTSRSTPTGTAMADTSTSAPSRTSVTTVVRVGGLSEKKSR